MKKINIIYWIVTGLFAAFMIFSGVTNGLVTKPSVDLISTQLGYPVYIISFIGWAKVLGGIVLLLPGFPRLKEWAYAGLTFDLIGATYSSIAVGEPFSSWVFMLVFVAFDAVSYIYYHKRLNYKS